MVKKKKISKTEYSRAAILFLKYKKDPPTIGSHVSTHAFVKKNFNTEQSRAAILFLNAKSTPTISRHMSTHFFLNIKIDPAIMLHVSTYEFTKKMYKQGV